MGHRGVGVLMFALFIVMAQSASAALMSIDLGSEFLKVCLVKPGRTPIAIAVNEMSKRKSPALVGVVNGERLLGEEAYSFAVRYPEAIFQRARDLLGKDPDDPTIATMIEEHGLPFKVVPHPKRGVASLQLGEEVYSPEELVGSILYYAKGIAEDQAGGAVTDAVITVPAFFGQRQRQALIDAASLAGLDVMGLINAHTAAALQYGIERDFTNRSQTIVLYDIGSGSTEVALVRYSTYSAKEPGSSKPKVVSQLEVKDVEWEAGLGSNLLDMALARHFAAQFAAKAGKGVDVMAVPKAMAKLRRQVRRTKEMLSANSAAPCTVEELYDGKDFQASITREEFESLAADFFTRAAEPLRRLLARNGLTGAELDAVELLGGGSRVPRLHAALSEALGGRGLDRHLDADEAVALGAGLFAANLSTSFRLRKFGMVDLSMYGVQLTLDHAVLGEGAEGGEPLQRVRNLLPHMKKLPSRRVVKLEGLAADPLRFSLAYNTSTQRGLPPGVKDPALAEFEATGIEGVVSRYNTSGQVSLRFEADYSGLLRLQGVEAVVEYEVMEEKIIEVPAEEEGKDTGADGKAEAADKDATAGEEAKEAKEGGEEKAERRSAKDNDTDEDEQGGGEEESGKEESGKEESGKEESGKEESGKEAAGEETAEEGEEGGKEEGKESGEEESGEEGEKEAAGDKEEGKGDKAKTAEGADAAKPAKAVRRVMVPKRKTAKVALKLGGKGWLVPSLEDSPAELAEAKKALSKWEAAEKVKRDIAKSRNDLESYIIAMKEALEADELFQKVSTEAQRDAFRALLVEDEDWLYMEADEGEGAQQFRDRLKALQAVGEPIKRRAEELELRPKVVAGIRQQLELAGAVIKAWPDTKPWIGEEERAALQKQLTDLEADLEAKVAAQDAKADTEEPAFTTNEVAAAWERFDKAYNKLNNKKKPKPPPEPKKDKEAAKEEGAKEGGAGAEGDKPAGEAEAGADKEAKQDAKQGGEQNGKQDAKDGNGKGDAKQEDKKGDKKAEKKEEAKKSGKEDSKKSGSKESKKDAGSSGKKEQAKKDTKKDAKKDTKKDQSKKDSKKDSTADAKKGAKKDQPKKEQPKKEQAKKGTEEAKKEDKGAKGKDAGGWSWKKKKEEGAEL